MSAPTTRRPYGCRDSGTRDLVKCLVVAVCECGTLVPTTENDSGVDTIRAHWKLEVRCTHCGRWTTIKVEATDGDATK